MNEKDWQIIVNLYEERNITKTARRMYISQPSLTYRIKQIEAEFKTNLIHRGNKGVMFTSEGEVVVEYAREMLKQLRAAQEKIDNISNELKGTLSLGFQATLLCTSCPVYWKASSRDIRISIYN